jgi:hypothetical protein
VIEFLEQRKISIQSDFVEPFFAKRPTSLPKHIGEMRMQNQNKTTIHVSLRFPR